MDKLNLKSTRLKQPHWEYEGNYGGCWVWKTSLYPLFYEVFNRGSHASVKGFRFENIEKAKQWAEQDYLDQVNDLFEYCLLYTSPSPRD